MSSNRVLCMLQDQTDGWPTYEILEDTRQGKESPTATSDAEIDEGLAPSSGDNDNDYSATLPPSGGDITGSDVTPAAFDYSAAPESQGSTVPQWRVGMRLEALDRETPCLISVATVGQY